jgi:hypothetical protein
MATILRTYSFRIHDQYGRDCGCRSEVYALVAGWYAKVQPTRDRRDYQKSNCCICATEAEAIGKSEAMVEAYRKRCGKQFAAAKAVA